MKKMIPFLLVMGFVSTVLAQNYKILLMNTKNIKIGSNVYKKGDVFSEDSVIYWSHNKQALKALNLKTKEIRLFVCSDFQKKQSRSVKDYYIKSNKLSTRGGISLSDMRDFLNDTTFYLLDTILIETPVPVDSSHYFYVSFPNSGIIEKHILPAQNETIVIARSLFPMANKCYEVKLSMAFARKGIEEDYLLTDSMRIVFIPLKIKHK